MFLLPSHVSPLVFSPWKHVTRSVFPHFLFFCVTWWLLAALKSGGEEREKNTHLWCWVAQLQRNLLAAIDLDVISREIVVCVGGWSCWLIHSSATTVTWTLVISSQGIHIAFYRHARANSKARMGIEMYVLVWNHQAVCACVCVRAAPIEGASVLLMNLRALWQDKVLAILCVEPTRGAGGQQSSCVSPTMHMLVRVCVLVISCVASVAEEAAGRR